MCFHFQLLAVLVGILAFGPLASRSAAQNPPAARPVAVLRQFTAEYSSPSLEAAQPAFAVSPAPEGTQPKHRLWKTAWIGSWVAFAVINALDVHSSAGRAEANPLLRGANGAFSGKRAALVKSGAGAGFLAVQWWVGRQNPERYRMFTIANTALNGGLAAIVVRNYRLSPPSPAAPGYVLRQTD